MHQWIVNLFREQKVIIYEFYHAYDFIGYSSGDGSDTED